MSRTIIAGNPDFKKPEIDTEDQLSISEFFCDTIQGEGIFTGQPATFLRLQHCTLECHWCDTQDVWRFGNSYSFDELFQLIEENDLVNRWEKRQHLVLTGGSPLRQANALHQFMIQFYEKYDFKPYIEIENECTLYTPFQFRNEITCAASPWKGPMINCWNNSPKLSNSGNDRVLRYQPEILQELSTLKNSWFKFVIMGEADWQEIEHDFIAKGHILRKQVILMPEGANRERLGMNREKVVEIAIREGVRYSTREHVVLWDKATGV